MEKVLSYWHFLSNPSSWSLGLALSEWNCQRLAVSAEELFLLCLPSGFLVNAAVSQPVWVALCLYVGLCWGWWVLHCWLLQTILSGLGAREKGSHWDFHEMLDQWGKGRGKDAPVLVTVKCWNDLQILVLEALLLLGTLAVCADTRANLGWGRWSCWVRVRWFPLLKKSRAWNQLVGVRIASFAHLLWWFCS